MYIPFSLFDRLVVGSACACELTELFSSSDDELTSFPYSFSPTFSAYSTARYSIWCSFFISPESSNCSRSCVEEDGTSESKGSTRAVNSSISPSGVISTVRRVYNNCRPSLLLADGIAAAQTRKVLARSIIVAKKLICFATLRVDTLFKSICAKSLFILC